MPEKSEKTQTEEKTIKKRPKNLQNRPQKTVGQKIL